MADLPWSQSEKLEIAKLWSEGHTAAAIAARFPGRTRNAVMGLAFRMKLPRRPNPIRIKERSPEQKKVIVRLKATRGRQIEQHRAEKATVVQFPPKPKPASRGVARYTGSEGCQWLEGERPTWTKCGATTADGSPWCDTHAARVWQKKDIG